MAQPGGQVRAGRHGTSWQRRIRTGLIVVLAVCVLLVGSTYFYLRRQVSHLARLDLPELVERTDSGQVMNVLMVGSDSREGTTGDLADATGKGEEGTAGQRSDTIMVLHIDPGQQKAAILSIHRDLYVPIPGNGRDKVNAAFSIGGPQLLIRTISEGLGIEINHYVEVDFTSVERIVNAVGGIKVYADAPARDEMTGLDLPMAGCNELDGYQALAFVRSRFYESYERGRWVAGTNSDIERIGRQQDFIRRMIKKAVSSGLTNPVTLNRLITIGVENVRVDQGMSTKDIATLARRFRSIDSESVDMLTLPTTGAFVGGASVLLLDTAKAQEFIDRLNGIKVEVPTVLPGAVSVKVLNGNGGDASASAAASVLTRAGYVVASTGNALRYDYAHTIVQFRPGQKVKAELLRSALSAGARIEEDATLADADVTLVLGLDYTGLNAAAAGASTGGGAATPTTVAGGGPGVPVPAGTPTTTVPVRTC